MLVFEEDLDFVLLPVPPGLPLGHPRLHPCQAISSGALFPILLFLFLVVVPENVLEFGILEFLLFVDEKPDLSRIVDVADVQRSMAACACVRVRVKFSIKLTARILLKLKSTIKVLVALNC